jgi:hypothetical protein
MRQFIRWRSEEQGDDGLAILPPAGAATCFRLCSPEMIIGRSIKLPVLIDEIDMMSCVWC